MKNQMLRVELHDGEVFKGIEVEMNEEMLSKTNFPFSLDMVLVMFSDGIWFLHSYGKKVSFLGNDIIKSKTIIK